MHLGLLAEKIGYAVLFAVMISAWIAGFIAYKAAAASKKAYIIRVSSIIGGVFFLMLVFGTRSLALKYGSLITLEAELFGLGFCVAVVGGSILGSSTSGRLALPALFLFGALWAGITRSLVMRKLYDVVQIWKTFQPSVPEASDATRPDCANNLRNLWSAFNLYAQDWDALPPAAGWENNNDLISKVRKNQWLHCPAVSNGHDNNYGYAYNDKIAGKSLGDKSSLKEMPDASKMPLLYDSTNLSKNAHDSFTSLPKPGRHHGHDNVLYLDGHVGQVTP